MRFARFSIAGLLMVVLASALGFAALRSKTDLAADATFSAFLGLLFFGTLAAWTRPEPSIPRASHACATRPSTSRKVRRRPQSTPATASGVPRRS